MSGWYPAHPTWRCLIGWHSRSRFGDCSRCGHVPFLVALGPDEEQPMARRYRAKVEAGKDLQAQMVALGEDVSLELCMDAATSGWSERLLDVARSHRAAAPAEAREEGPDVRD